MMNDKLNKVLVTASIVLYKENINDLQYAINSVLNSNVFDKLILIDNSPSNFIEKYIVNEKIEYVYVGKNIGFGAAHNLAIKKVKKQSDFHLILNPDVIFNPSIIKELLNQLIKDESVALVAPKVFFPNGNLQNSSRRYPKFSEMFFRRVRVFHRVSENIVNLGIYSDKNLDKPFFPQYLTGCFHLYRTSDLVKIGGFDERYFLYMEDVDICKKIDQIGKKKLYFPKTYIYHTLKKGSSKKLKLFFLHTVSMLKYFNKWGFKP